MNEVFEKPLVLSDCDFVDALGVEVFVAANELLPIRQIPMLKEQTTNFLKKDFILHLKPVLPGCFL